MQIWKFDQFEILKILVMKFDKEESGKEVLGVTVSYNVVFRDGAKKPDF